MKNKSRTVVKVKGLNQERVLNNLSKNVNIYNYQRQQQNLSQFEVDFKDRHKIAKLLKSEGVEVLSISHYGFFSSLLRMLTSYGLIAGIIVSLAFYLLQYNFVLKVEVWGMEENNKEIASFIEENLDTRMKNSINLEIIEKSVRDNFQNVSSISVAIVGQTLVVNVNQTLIPDEMQGDYAPIISNSRSIITEIKLIQGTLNVAVGDIVRKGDVLVYPYVIDSQGEKRDVAPIADIMANVWYKETYEHYDTQIVTERTGRKTSRTEVLLGNLSIYKNNNNIKYGQFDTEEYIKPLTKNLILPFNIKKTIYYETQTKEINMPFSQEKDKIIEKVRQNILLFLQENEIIIKEDYKIREGGGVHIIDYMMTTNKNIGGTNEN